MQEHFHRQDEVPTRPRAADGPPSPGGAAAEATARDLRLLLLGDGGSAATRWAEQAREQLRGGRDGGEDAMRLSLVHSADLAELAGALRQDLPGVVVLLGDAAVLSQTDLQALLRETAAPVSSTRSQVVT